MKISELDGRLILWRMRFSEFDFNVKYMKSLPKNQPDVLSRLHSLGEIAVVPVDTDIPSYPLHYAPDSRDLHVLVDVDDLLAETTDTALLLVPITPVEQHMDQKHDGFCCTMRARI